jgi:hypothetical protein
MFEQNTVGENAVLWNNREAAHTILSRPDGRDGTKDIQAALAAIRGVTAPNGPYL